MAGVREARQNDRPVPVAKVSRMSRVSRIYVYLLIIALELRESAAAGSLGDRRVRDESVTLLFPPYARSDAGTVVDVIEDRAATVKQALGQWFESETFRRCHGNRHRFVITGVGMCWLLRGSSTSSQAQPSISRGDHGSPPS